MCRSHCSWIPATFWIGELGVHVAKHDSRFGKLAKQLDMELESAVMQRVFNEIDEEGPFRQG
jgi:hypothetical protein